MSLQYIIDGYNLIKHRSFQGASKIKDSKRALLEFLRTDKPCGSTKNTITVVFDGYAGGEDFSGADIEVIFSCDTSADERIKRLLELRNKTKNIVVVSDDNEIKEFARLSNATALGIEEFINPPKKKKARLENDSLKPELTYSEMHKINQELKKIWLK